MNRKRKRKRRAGICLLSGIWLAVMPALTNAEVFYRTETLANTFEPGGIDIELLEPDFEQMGILYPGKTIRKNPQIRNTGSHGVIVFLEVDIPRMNIPVVADRLKGQAEMRELFDFTADEAWKAIGSVIGDDCMTYVFGWKQVVGPGETTRALFETLTTVDYPEGALPENEIIGIPVRARAVQVEASGLEPSESAALPDRLDQIYRDYFEEE